MAKISKRIEIIRTDNTALSSMSRSSADAVCDTLSRYYTDVKLTHIETLADVSQLIKRNPDLAFLGMKYLHETYSDSTDQPVKLWLSKLLDDAGIASTGSNAVAHELELDKALAKQRVRLSGLPTSPFIVMAYGNNFSPDIQQLSFPLFVKPTNRGGGAGIDSSSLVTNMLELEQKVSSLADKLQCDALIETYLPGREFSVAILKAEHTGEFNVMPIELIAPLDEKGSRILSQAIKSADSETHIAVTDKVLRSRLKSLALNVFYALGARDYGRIDIRLDADGNPQFLEANLIPSLLDNYGNFPRACKLNINLGYDQVLQHIVRLGLTRGPQPKSVHRPLYGTHNTTVIQKQATAIALV